MIQSLFLLIAVVAAIVLLVRAFMTLPPTTLARSIRNGGGYLLLLAAAGLALLRQFAIALPLAFIGFAVLRRGGFGGARPTGGGASSVQSAGLDMRLDHDTGEMDGRVLAGRHEGAMLSDLDLERLFEVAEDFRDDAESLRLLEGYLDRTFPRWRDEVNDDADRRAGAPPSAGAMTKKEAYNILGLEPGAGDAEIRKVHRRLMKQVHPDHGGSAALAARINEAKDTLLGDHD
jgi:hypothetical protein